MNAIKKHDFLVTAIYYNSTSFGSTLLKYRTSLHLTDEVQYYIVCSLSNNAVTTSTFVNFPWNDSLCLHGERFLENPFSQELRQYDE